MGVNVTVMEQLDPGARAATQVFVWAKSPEFVPVMVMLLTLIAVVPVFCNVATCAMLGVPIVWFGNGKDAGETTVATPVPLRLTICGLPNALSVKAMKAASEPATLGLGVNVTLILQLAPGTKMLPQVFVCAKSPLFVPAIRMLAIVRGAVPEFCRVTL